MSFWDTLGNVVKNGNPAGLAFNLGQALAGNDAAQNNLNAFLPMFFQPWNRDQQPKPVQQPNGTWVQPSGNGIFNTLGQLAHPITKIPGYDPVSGPVGSVAGGALRLATAPLQLGDRGLTAVELYGNGISWDDAWAASSEEGVDIGGKHVSNMNIGEATQATFREALAGNFVNAHDSMNPFSRSDASSDANGKRIINQVNTERTSWGGMFTSGVLDTALTWYIDPTLGVGKLTKLARVADVAGSAARTEKVVDAAHALNEAGAAPAGHGIGRALSLPGSETGLFAQGPQESAGRMHDWLSSTMYGGNPEGRKRVVARSPDSAPYLALMGMADRIADPTAQMAAKIDIHGAAGGVEASRQRLIKNFPDIAAAQMRLNQAPQGRVISDTIADAVNHINKLDPAELRAFGQTFHDAAVAMATPQNMDELGAYGHHFDNLHNAMDQLQQVAEVNPLEGAGLSALDRAKASLHGKIHTEFYFNNGPGSTTVRVLHSFLDQKFEGTVDVENALTGSQELGDHLKRTGLYTGQEVVEHQRKFETTLTKEGRRRVIDNVHHEMFDKVAAKYQDRFPDLTADDLRAMKAQTLEVHAAARKYSAAQIEASIRDGLDYVYLGDPSGEGSWTTVNRAHFQTHIANNAALPQPSEIEDMLKSQYDMGPAAWRDAISNAGGLLNGTTSTAFHNAWRNAVLARPGLLMRTQIDTQGRALAVLHGFTVVGNALKGLGHEFQRVKAGGDPEEALGNLVNDQLHAEKQFTRAARLREIAKERAGGRTAGAAQAPTLDDVGAGLRNPSDTDVLYPGELDLPLDINDLANMSAEALNGRAAALERDGHAALARTVQQKKYRLGVKPVTVNGQTFDPAYVGAQNMRDKEAAFYTGHRPTRTMTDSAFVGRQERLNDSVSSKQSLLYEDAHNHQTYEPTHHFWEAGWIRHTDVMRNDAINDRILRMSDSGVKDMVEELRNDKAVQAEWREVRGDNPNFIQWIGGAIMRVALLAPTPEVRSALLSHGHMNTTEVDKLFARMKMDPKTKKYVKADPNDPLPERPYVSGPAFSKTRPDDGTKLLGRAVRRFISAMSDRPDLAWGRHPFYVGRYRHHLDVMSRDYFVEHPGEVKLPLAEQKKMQDIATHRAIKDTTQTFYDTARHTGVHAMLRNASPFVGAWEDAMTSWSRLAYDDLGRASAFNKLWNVPNRMGIVVDQDGNPVRPGQHSEQSYVLFPAEWSNHFDPKTMKTLSIRKDSFNSIIQGVQWYTPGVGPGIGIPVQEITAKLYPELGDSKNPIAQAFFPFGTPKTKTGGNLLENLTADVLTGVLPSWTKGFLSAYDQSNPANALAFKMSVNEQLLYAKKNGLPVPSHDELYKNAAAHARSAGFVRALTSGLGFSGGNLNNGANFYKQQLDLFYQRQDELAAQGITPEEAFVKEFPEAKGLTWGLTKSTTGVNAYISALKAEDKYKTYITAHPEAAWYYVGVDNVGGEFSQSAYNTQASRNVPGSNTLERRLYSREEMVGGSMAEQGWDAFGKVQGSIDAELAARGLNNVNQKGAADLKQIKDDFVKELRKQNDAWATDYDQNDPGKIQRFIDSVAKPSLTDSKLKNRPDVMVTGQYLAVRDQALKELGARGYKSLDTQHAADLRAILFDLGTTLSRTNLAFSQTWDRVLSHEVDK